MNELVIMINKQAVTSSLQVAENFDKEHRNVLRDVEALKKDVHNFEQMFFESSEPDSYGRDRKTYLMNRDGFTLLAMGFTGSKALQFKLKYIEAFNEMEKQINKPMSQLELMQMQISQLVEQEKRLTGIESRTDAIEKKQDNITEVLSLNPTEWRKKTTNLLNKIAQQRGGFDAFKDVRTEAYEQLEERGKCQLSIRLTNRKRKAALEGLAKSRIDKINRMDVIADDARLVEVFLSIVKEMAIKYGVEVEAS